MRAILITKDPDGHQCVLRDVAEDKMPDGDVTIQVDYSALNYKDSLAITGESPVVRSFPMIPGIDLAGTVTDSSTPHYQIGDAVLINGWGLGESHWGGHAEKARVNHEWLVPLPRQFSTRQAMALGTAGLTAMLGVLRLEDLGLAPDRGEVVVTGASGGVGSIAVRLLASLGYDVLASTGSPENEEYLMKLGATRIIPRPELSTPGRPLDTQRWAGAIDTVGGHTLANLCAATRYDGVVVACGLAESSNFPSSVLPFILRAVALAGIDSVYSSSERRTEAWQRLTSDLDISSLELMTSEIGLSEVIPMSRSQLEGRIRGRVVVDVKS